MFKQNKERPIFVKMFLKVSSGCGEEFATMMHESVSQGTWSVQRIIGYVINTKRLGWCAAVGDSTGFYCAGNCMGH